MLRGIPIGFRRQAAGYVETYACLTGALLIALDVSERRKAMRDLPESIYLDMTCLALNTTVSRLFVAKPLGGRTHCTVWNGWSLVMGKRSKRSVLDGQGAKMVLGRRSRVPRNKYERIAECECVTNHQMLRVNIDAKTHQTAAQPPRLGS
jgi:hypothetical protein